MKNVLVLFFVSIFILILTSCEKKEELPFSTDTVTSIGNVSFFSNSYRDGDSSVYYFDGSSIKKYRFSQVIESSGKIDSQTTTIADLGSLGFSSPDILDMYTSPCSKKTYVLIQENSETVHFLDIEKETTSIITSKGYNHGKLWVNDCSGNIVSQSLLFFGGVYTDGDGISQVSDLTYVDFFHYNDADSTQWQHLDNVFDSMGDPTELFENASNIRLSRWYGDSSSHYGSTIMFINKNSHIKLYKLNDINNFNNLAFSDATYDEFNQFANMNLMVRSFDIFYYSDFNNKNAHICAVASKDGNNPSVYFWQPRSSYSSMPSVATDYAGTCSIVNYSKADAYASYYYPWVSYHSAKNRLSLAHIGKSTGEMHIIETFVDIPQSRWHFASKVHSLSKTTGDPQRIMAIYDDNNEVKITVCKEQSKCSSRTTD